MKKNQFYAVAITFAMFSNAATTYAQGYYCVLKNVDEHNGCFAQQECCTGNDGLLSNCVGLGEICSQPKDPKHPTPPSENTSFAE